MFFNPLATALIRLTSRRAFSVYGKARGEKDWRVIDVFATKMRDQDSRWPALYFRGVCITYTASAIAVGWDFAEEVLREQITEPASRERPVEVFGGRLHDLARRTAAGGEPWPSASEVLAHECGHTLQARRLSWLYLPTGALFTLWREGPRWYNAFENQASESGQFGGLVNGSVCAELMARCGLGTSGEQA
jgi:hypothetical protein